MRKFFKINFKLIIGVFIVEALICSGELIMIIKNYQSGTEQWPWFFTFTANLPASVAFSSFLNLIYERYADSVNIQIISSYIVFLLGGTLWWSLLLHALSALIKAIQHYSRGFIE
jgi:hypothetical protein